MLESLTNFLGGPLPIFYGIAGIASLVLLVQLAMTALGFDDLDGADDAEFGSDIFTFRSLTGFFGGFGWTGVLMLENGFSVGVSTLAGIVAGTLLMMSFVYLMRLMYSLRESGTVDLTTAVGRTGTVYVSIPEGGSAHGQIQVIVGGRVQVLPATTRSGRRIPSGSQVRILELIDATTLLVEPMEPVTNKEI